jgi:hypothetical protein
VKIHTCVMKGKNSETSTSTIRHAKKEEKWRKRKKKKMEQQRNDHNLLDADNLVLGVTAGKL